MSLGRRVWGARDAFVEFVLRFTDPCLASGRSRATIVSPFTYVTPQSVAGADGGYLIVSPVPGPGCPRSGLPQRPNGV